ncbi:hypothetical protein [Streptococcus ovis]|uniref:hypothetical protein n=1 Tax=Streptococcus ovis TaxID=82806 RepID=UPI00146142CE|nr:hypothetical protein [Streptococcus ovis]
MKQWIFFDLGSTLIDERETYRFFQERCVRELHVAGCCVTAKDFEEQMLRFAKENKDPVKETWAFFATGDLVRPKWDHSTECPLSRSSNCVRKIGSVLPSRYYC